MNKLTYIKNSIFKIIYFLCIFVVVNLILYSSKALSESFYDIVYVDFLIITISLFFMLIDYITKWIHEVKTPLSVCELILDKMEETDISEQLRLEIDRIRFLVNQVLYISRTSNFSEDFQPCEINVGKIVRDVIKENMSFFIRKKINLNLGNVNFHVITDRKWISYIIDQIINNGCRYVYEGRKIDVWGEENGRKFGKSTGSIIYFKLVSEAYIDKAKYGILERIGMTDKEIYSASARQIGISYLFPLIVGIVHSSVVLSVLSDLMNYNIMVPAILSIVIFIFVYGIYFMLTTKKYLKIVL